MSACHKLMLYPQHQLMPYDSKGFIVFWR